MPGRKGGPVRGEGGRLDGAQPQARVWTSGRDARACVACEAHRAGRACAPLVPGTGPRLEGCGGVCETPARPCGATASWSTAIVLGLGPIEPSAGGPCVVGSTRPGSPPRGCSSGAQGQARVRAATAGEGAGGAAALACACVHTRTPAGLRVGAQASGAVAWRLGRGGCMCLLSLTAPCQGWTVSRQAGQSTYKGPGADGFQPPLLRRSRFRQQLRPSVRQLERCLKTS
jgi:hypothetical protein